MNNIRKSKLSGQGRGFGAFALCSAFTLLGAAAGCFSGSYAGAAAEMWSETGHGFGEYLAGNLLMVGAVLVLGSSGLGMLLLPLLSGAGGFVSGFVLSAFMVTAGSWGEVFMRCGWFVAAAMPVFLVLCASAMRMSGSVLRLMLFGARAESEITADFLKALMISVLLAFLLALAAAAA